MRAAAGASIMNMHATAPATPPAHVTPAADPAGPPVIRLDAVTKVFRPHADAAAVTALDAVDLSVASGEIVGIIGRSGAGKSTLVRVINGLEKPTSGSVIVGDVELSALGEAEARRARRSIGMVFQHFNLLSSRTAAGNIALPLEIAGVPAAQIRARVDELIGLVGLTAQRDRYPAELSGGQKQRVGIARALASRPHVLLCDEATSALDPETTHQILDLLARIRAELGLTIILITHEMAVVKTIADRVAVLDQGRIVEQGPTFQVFAHPQHPTTRRFVGTVTGAFLPDSLRAALQPEPIAGGKAVIRITFTGPQANEPVLSRLARVIGIELNILSGQIEEIGGKPFGTLVVAVPGDTTTVAAVQAALTRLQLSSEVIGHVA
jgi:D-methionine transport system ATP-binding protein